MSRRLTFAFVPAMALVLGACATAGTPVPAGQGGSSAPNAGVSVASPSASTSATPSSPVPSPPAVAGGGTAAAWCVFVIEINTKFGYMTNKHYSSTPPSPDVQRQIVTEALSRLDEWVAKTPPEIKDATDAEIAYFQQVKAYGDAHGWTDAAAFPQPTAAQTTAMLPLVPYQKTECGISFGK